MQRPSPSTRPPGRPVKPAFNRAAALTRAAIRREQTPAQKARGSPHQHPEYRHGQEEP